MTTGRFTPALRFALLANLTSLVLGLVTGDSLLVFCILMFFTQLLIVLIGGYFWFRECDKLNWSRSTLVLCLLFTPYVLGLGAAALVHQRYHQEAENIPPPRPGALNLPMPAE